MTEPRWLERKYVERLHDTMIEVGGGANGLRDPNLLESALARPRTLFGYGEEDIFRLVSVYAEGIARNHPFIDGNKRTAFTSATAFLFANGFDLVEEVGDEHADMMVALAQGDLTRDEAAEHFRKYSEPRA